MKKLICLIMTLALIATTSVTAFAADITSDSISKEGSTTVNYSVDPTYTVTIPATVALGNSAEIKAEDVVVAKGSQVVVKLSGTSEKDGAFKVKSAEGAELTYAVKNGEKAVAVGDAVLSVNPEIAATGSATLTFVSPTSIQYAGEYAGTVNFTVAVELITDLT